MELTTRCPQCGTAFPVSLEQLQLRKGYIRCIQCAHIFDGFDAVVPSEPRRPGGSDVPQPTAPQASPSRGGAAPFEEPEFFTPPLAAEDAPAGPLREEQAAGVGAFIIPPSDHAPMRKPRPSGPGQARQILNTAPQVPPYRGGEAPADTAGVLHSAPFDDKAPMRPFSIGPGPEARRQPGKQSGGEPSLGGPSVPNTPPDEASAGEQPFIPSRSAMPDGDSREPRMPSVVRQRSDMRAGPSFTISSTRELDGDMQRNEPIFAYRPGREPVASGRAQAHHSLPGERPANAGFPAGNRHAVEGDALADRSGTAAGQYGKASEETEKTGDFLFIEPRTGRRSAQDRAEFFDGPHRRRTWMAPVWGALTLCGLIMLLVQGVYVYRAQLANNFPAFRPSLEEACERIGCTVPYERHIDAIAITASALRSSAAPQDGVSALTLEVTLRNVHERPQEWPTLVLDLKDASGSIVVRRNLPPPVWVPARQLAGPFAAGSEITVQLPVSVRGLLANGYQLDKFFP